MRMPPKTSPTMITTNSTELVSNPRFCGAAGVERSEIITAGGATGGGGGTGKKFDVPFFKQDFNVVGGSSIFVYKPSTKKNRFLIHILKRVKKTLKNKSESFHTKKQKYSPSRHEFHFEHHWRSGAAPGVYNRTNLRFL